MARIVRVASVSYSPPFGANEADRKTKILKNVQEVLAQVAHDKPDVICLPETFTGMGLPLDKWAETAEPVAGPTTEALAKIAKRHGTYVVCPMVEEKGGSIYNSAVLIDRKGGIVGTYHKMHPTIGEIEQGVVPGTKAEVLETDFGRVGFAICYDLNFRDVAESNAEGGAELVFFPSMYRGGLQLSIWAFDFGFYIVSSTPGEMSAIVNPLGKVLVHSWNYSRTIVRDINLDGAVLHIDENHAKLPGLKKKYGPSVEVDLVAPEAVFLLTSWHKKKSVHEMIEEFALETRKAYFARANKVREKALKKFKKRSK